MNKTIDKIELLCQGIRVDESEPYFSEVVPEKYAEGGKSRAGVAGSGKSFLIDGEEACNIGVLQPHLSESPFEFKIIDGNGWILKDGEKLTRATLREPEWHNTPLRDKIQLHGKDSLATALSNFCIYKKEGQGCKFCIIDVGKEVVFQKPTDIARTIEEIETSPDLRNTINIEDRYDPDLGQRDILSRTIKPKDININAGKLAGESRLYEDTISQIREVSKLPIFIEIGPLSKDQIEKLHSVGTDAMSFNLEVYLDSARKEVIPGKGRDTSPDDYFKAMEIANDILGDNQVSSWILVGLEPPEKTVEGMRKIAETGAIPLPKPFRPLYGADFENRKPPTVDDAKMIYTEWLDIIRDCGLKPSKACAGCVRCGACFPIKELLKHGI